MTGLLSIPNSWAAHELPQLTCNHREADLALVVAAELVAEAAVELEVDLVGLHNRQTKTMKTIVT